MKTKLINKILSINPIWRRLILLPIDLLILLFSLKLCFYKLNIEGLLNITNISILKLFIISIIIYFFTGQYNPLTRYSGSSCFYKIVLRNSFLSIIFFKSSFDYIFNYTTNILQFWFLGSTVQVLIRLLLRDLLYSILQNKIRKKTGIYGAGSAGIQLAKTLKFDNSRKLDCFFDDNKFMSGRNIDGIPIFPSSELENKSKYLDEILLAIPSLNKNKIKLILNKLSELNLNVLQVPSIEELTQNKAKIDSLKSVEIEELLGREKVKPFKDLISKGIANKNIFVSGAGGSIGSEICKKIIENNAKKLVLLDSSEISLYKIDKKLRNIKSNVQIIPVLGDASNSMLMKKIFVDNEINVVFHAAAYKHVPLVEQNPLVGIYNNVFSTKVLCDVCMDTSVDKFMFVSTDKAVRPTNVMGASKRLSELVVQSFSNENFEIIKNDFKKTIFSIVRFGNVLGSSGSVVPLFKEQINSGGPITLTHPDVIRYFMTLQEAAELVIQASSISGDGELFLLDMGEPVLIKKLAEKMIKLSGLSIKDENNPKGKIEIVHTGLRDGEKLYEELLIDAKAQPTEHPLIFKAKEKSILSDILWIKLNNLEKYIKDLDVEKTFLILNELVPEWKRNKT